MITLSEELAREKELRLKKIDQMMIDLGLDAVVFTSTSQMSYQMLLKYVTKLTLQTRRAFVMKEVGKEPELFVPMAGDRKTYFNRSWIDIESIYLGNMIPTVIEHIENLPQAKPVIGWAMVEEIPQPIYAALKGTKAEFVDITKEYTKLRSSKSEYEVKLTQLTSDLAVGSFEDAVRRIKPGMTEVELIGGAIGYLSSRGAEDMLILTQSKQPYATIKWPQPVPIRSEDVVVYSAEFGGPGGYWTQLIRPIFMDRISNPDTYEIWKVALEAEQAAAAAAKPGNRVCDVHFAIAKCLEKYGMWMSYWAGHGMGCDLGDGVDIGPNNTMEIVPNMVLTLQPSVESPKSCLLYGNTFLARENGDALNFTGKYMNSPFYEDLINEVPKL